MPLVFVHGVNVREGKQYRRETEQRNESFSKILFPLIGRELQPENIFNPYWGDLATNLTPGNLFIPAAEPLLIHRLANRLANHDGSLLTLARRKPMRHVLDVMIAASFETDEEKCDAAGVSQFAYLLLRFGQKFNTIEDQLDWLSNVNSDAEFITKIERELEHEPEIAHHPARLEHLRHSINWLGKRYGHARERARSHLRKVGDRLRNDLSRARLNARQNIQNFADATRSATTRVAAHAVTQPARKMFHDRMFFFIGDAFMYFQQRGTADAPGPIISRLSDALDEAGKKVDSSDPSLVMIAHSMGGNIACDYVSQFAGDRKIDLLITVGTQFPLFADLQMFPGLGLERPFRKPDCVKRWINVYDANDVFAFTAAPLFEGIEDFAYASGRFGITTHADCFKFISLYEHIARAVLSVPIQRR